MEANELRIGNWLIGKGDLIYQANVYQVTEISRDVIWIGDEIVQFTYPLDMVKPIPLTEGWAVKLGFDQTKHNVFEYAKGHYILDNEYTDKDSWNFVCRDEWLAEIKYVHQLQNIYFALEGEEL